MSPQAQFNAFAQSVYLVIKNRYFDDLTSTDGITYVAEVVDWTNQFIDELEAEVDAEGNPVDWNWVRQAAYPLGTAAVGTSIIDKPSEINNVVVGEQRYVQVTVNGTVVSNFSVVSPSDIDNFSGDIIPDMCTVIGSSIVFSRAFRANEDGGAITGDATLPLPRVTTNNGIPVNIKILTTVIPKQLLILGVAKNASLPDIVQGGLSPSYAQKYNDLLQNAILRNARSSLSNIIQREDFSNISGIGF